MTNDTAQPPRMVFRLNRRRLFVAAVRICALVWVPVLVVYLLFYHLVRDAMVIVANRFHSYDLLLILVGVLFCLVLLAGFGLRLARAPREIIVDGHGMALRFAKRTIQHSWDDAISVKISGPRMRKSGPWRSRTAEIATSLARLHIRDGDYVTEQGTSMVSAIEDQLRRAGKTIEYA